MKALMRVVILFIASRLLIGFFLNVGQPDHIHYSDNQLQLDNPIVDHFVIYDSYNYKQIASEGYSEPRLTAFFPLFPLLVRGVHLLTGMDIYGAGVLLSNFFFVCAMWVFDQLMEKRGVRERVRSLTLGILAFFPSSYFFSAFYTESFFLFLALLAFRFWGDEKREAAYIIGGLAALSRIVGVWIPLAFFLERWIRRKLDPKDFAWAFISSLIFFCYPGYLWLTEGDLLSFLKVQSQFFERYSSFPFYPVYQDIVWSIEKWQNARFIEFITVFHLILFIIFISYIISTVRLWRKGGHVVWSEFIYTSALITMSLSSVVIRPLDIASHGFMRYFLTVFPLFIFLGQQSAQAVMRAELSSGSRFIIGRKAINYCVLLLWVIFSVCILMALRQKGFVA